MRIVRTRATRFAVIPQAVAEDARLSYRARGVLVYLLSRPSGWSTDSVRLAKEGQEGRDAIRTALRELEEHGYLIRTRTQLPNGRWVTQCEVIDNPTEDGKSGPGGLQTGDGFPGIGFPVPQTPNTDNEPPLPPNDDSHGGACEKHAKSLGRPHGRCRACGTAGRPACDVDSPARHSGSCRRGDSRNCAAPWCECACHRRQP